jgi:hypothetical protein
VLRDCDRFGVDLEGKLNANGHIDFIQISAIRDDVKLLKGMEVKEKKQIFILDIYVLKKESLNS